jgi:anaerobic selenocysteine-containing dehydrogenase
MAATRPSIFLNLLEEKKKRGCRLVCIDPRKTETACYSDIWLAIRPGTDMALALGMIHYILKHHLEDKQFLAEKTEGFAEFKKELFAHGYDTEWAAKITGLGKEEIENLARLYALTPKAIIIGNAGLSHHTNAVQTHRAFYFLAAITGHFGKPSVGYGCLNNGGHKIGAIPLPKDKLPKLKPSLGKNPGEY